MTDNSYSGPMSMVKIDGAKIKQLREQQGLTQLYLATSVEVTTDTISRWENKRYPSIKRDNGIKLAAALNVQLEELFEETVEEEYTEPARLEAAQEGNVNRADSQTPTPGNELVEEIAKKPLRANTGFGGLSHAKVWPLLILSGVLLAVILFFAYTYLQYHSPTPLSALRILPPHCIANQPFPVLIRISGAPDSTTALILKETLPKNSTIHSSSPEIASGAFKNGRIKWLQKIENSATFSYMVSIPGNPGDSARFDGKATIANISESPIEGEDHISFDTHHWADSDQDNVISDDEILNVYDRYSEITGIEEEIDLVEEIWMGSSYLWDEETNSYKIND